MNENIEKFLLKLTELSKEHNLWLDSCGCCDSISVAPKMDGKKEAYTFEEIDDGCISGLGVDYER
jgi:hypothetical protein